MPQINVKEHPELRHVLTHISYAIRALAEGKTSEAIYELDQVEGLIMWESDEAMSAHIESINYGKPEDEELQRQEELQE